MLLCYKSCFLFVYVSMAAPSVSLIRVLQHKLPLVLWKPLRGELISHETFHSEISTATPLIANIYIQCVVCLVFLVELLIKRLFSVGLHQILGHLHIFHGVLCSLLFLILKLYYCIILNGCHQYPEIVILQNAAERITNTLLTVVCARKKVWLF